MSPWLHLGWSEGGLGMGARGVSAQSPVAVCRGCRGLQAAVLPLGLLGCDSPFAKSLASLPAGVPGRHNLPCAPQTNSAKGLSAPGGRGDAQGTAWTWC